MNICIALLDALADLSDYLLVPELEDLKQLLTRSHNISQRSSEAGDFLRLTFVK